MKRRVGDKVRVRSWESMESEFGAVKGSFSYIDIPGCAFVEQMRKTCGKVFTIKIVSNTFYLLLGDTDNCMYTDEMLEDVCDEFTPTHVVVDAGDTYPIWNEKARALGGDMSKWRANKAFPNGTKVQVLNQQPGYALITDGEYIVVIDPIGLEEIKITSSLSETIKKEKEEEDMNVLEKMANKDLEKELVAAGAQGLPAGIKAALEEQIMEEQKEASKKAARQIMSVLGSHTASIDSEVRQLRDIRRQEAAIKARIEKLNLAKAYGMETQNFIPLAILTGNMYKHQVEDQALCEVPKEFVPATVETEKPAKTPKK